MLSWEYPPNIVGGLGQHVYDLSRFMARLGVEVHVITPRIEGIPDNDHLNGVYIHRAGNPSNRQQNFKAWTFYFNGDAIRQAVALVSNSESFDVIHAHDWLAAYAGRALSSVYEIPLVSTIHATEHGRNRGLYNRTQHEINEIERNLAAEASHVICCSRFMKNEIIRQFGLSAEGISVIPNGVDLDQLQDVPYQPGIIIPEGVWPVVFLGRLVPEKGVDCLIRAFSRLSADYTCLRLYVCGKGPERDRLEKLGQELGIGEKIEFTGFIERTDRNYLYSRACIAVFPSIYEPFGIVALEAMAAGTPVIASDTGGLAEIIENRQNGLLFPPGDDKSLAAAIAELLDDPDQTDGMRFKAKNRVREEYDWTCLASATLNVYKKAQFKPGSGYLDGEQ